MIITVPKNNWGKFQAEVLLIHSAELDVTIKGIITAEFCTGTWFGRRNIVGMKCARTIVCRSFSKSGSRFVQRENSPMFRNKYDFNQKSYQGSVFLVQAGVLQMRRMKKGIEFPLDSLLNS